MLMPCVTNPVSVLIIVALIVLSNQGATSSHSRGYMSSVCNETNSYISGSVFEANLNNTLYSRLLPKASLTGFWNFSQGSDADEVYGLFYCKGDVDQQTCRDCVEAATRKITDVCKSSKEGIVWFEECTLRYANRTIFSVDEEKPYFLYSNVTGIVNEYRLDQHKDVFDTTMDALIQEAAYGHGKGSLPGFAAKEVNLSSTEIIRGFAQCTPDIIGPGCYRCLKAGLRLRDTWANTMVILPSCFFTYDLYVIVPFPAPFPPKHNQRVLLFATAAFVVFFVLVVIGGCWLRRLRSKGVAIGPTNLPRSSSEKEGDTVQGLPKYSFSEVDQMTEGFKTRLGKGGYGVVYHGHLLDGSREVAVKVLSEDDAPMQFSNEINVFLKISHKNLVSLLGYCKDGINLALIYEFMDKGDLRTLLSENAGSVSWTDRLKIAIDTAEGLHYLHSHCEVPIIHRDVKPDNILLNQRLQAKVADFGLTKIFPEKDVTTLKTQVVSTPGYTAPGYSTTGRLNAKADVYSFGVVLLELITGVTPRMDFDLVEWFENVYKAGNIEEILDPRIKEQRMQILENGCAWKAIEVAKTCVEKDEKKRPKMWEVLVNLKQCLNMVYVD